MEFRAISAFKVCYSAIAHLPPTMPNNRKSTLKKISGRDGVHPGSRKGTSNQGERAGWPWTSWPSLAS